MGFSSITPYWARILYFMFTSESKSSKIKRDFRIFKKNILRLIFFHKYVFGFPQKSSATIQHQHLHEVGSWTNFMVFVFFSLRTSIYSSILGIIASIPFVCSLYGKIDDYLCKIGVIEHEIEDSFPDEKWIFINGICTSRSFGIMNREMISLIFNNRRVTLLHNPTEGPVLDILECIIGRTLESKTNADKHSYEYVRDQLKDGNKKKVVLIGHSQGAIIVSCVLDQLQKDYQNNKLTKEEVKKLEVYTFGSPADRMNDLNGLVYCEHFVNDYDFVPRLGIMDNEINYQTERVFYGRKKSGHFLNQHYLSGFKKQEYKSKSGFIPRLYNYLSP